MSRPKKCRRVCRMPRIMHFGPLDGDSVGHIQLSVDEYEALRLMDIEGFTQEQCAVHMDIARATVAVIYDSARRKLADALVHGHIIEISGGDVIICEHFGPQCGDGCRSESCCHSSRFHID